MTFNSLIRKTFRYFIKGNLATALGVALSAAVITGALLVGESVDYSLRKAAHERLGKITHTVSAGERIFSDDLAYRMQSDLDIPAASVLKTEARALSSGGKYSLSKVNVWGIDEHFGSVAGVKEFYDSLQSDEVIISRNTAERMMLKKGDRLVLQIRKIGVIPSNTPFTETERTVSQSYTVKAVADNEALGRLNMRQSQTAPFNVFLRKSDLENRLDLTDKANMILLSETEDIDISKITRSLNQNATPEDVNLNFRRTDENLTEIVSERVFIDSVSAKIIKRNFPQAEPVLSYFVNSFQIGDAATPYSFISGLSELDLQPDEILINEWLAEDLQAFTGDTLKLSYFTVGPMRRLSTDSADFVVKEIVPIEGIYADASLMPELPGLSDAGSCSEWETGVPVVLDKIRDKDESYWKRYRGTPKAFISYTQAAELWQNRFGAYTAFRLSADRADADKLSKKFAKNLNMTDFGFSVNPVLKQGLKAASGGVDFGQLFLALSFFIIVSGLLLTALLFKFHLNNRKKQIQLFNSLGFSRSRIIKILLGEQIFTILPGVILGLLLAPLYNELVFAALNGVWYDIVRTDVLETHLAVGAFFTGGVSAAVLSFVVLYFSVKRLLKQEFINKKKSRNLKFLSEKKWLPTLLILVPLAVISSLIMQFSGDKALNPASFFISGALLLIFTWLLTAYFLKIKEKNRLNSLSLPGLSAKNAVRNPLRSLMIVFLLSIGSFLVVSVGINKKDLFSGAENPHSGTGGFPYYAETTVPILEDLNQDSVRKSYAFSAVDSVVQFRMTDGEDAGCLNLNRVSQPAVLSVNPDDLRGHFAFETRTDYLQEEAPWESLDADSFDWVPAIADQTVILWGLGMKVGDDLEYLNAYGDTVRFKLIGGLKASVFQGKIIISEKHFLKHFPGNDGSRLLLADGNWADTSAMREELSKAFSDRGLSLEITAARLAEFKTIENTYLNIFLVLGAIGLLLGMAGLAVVLAGSLNERRSETALLTAVGYSDRQIFVLYFREYFVLTLVGLLGGVAAAFLSVLPSVLSPNTDVNPVFVLLLVGAIILAAAVFIALSIRRQLKTVNLGYVLNEDLDA